MQDEKTLPALPSWRVLGAIIAAFFAIVFAVFGAALWHEFVLWDDTYLIFSNPVIKEISWKTIKEAFTTYDPELYIPLTIVSYQIDYLIAGLEPFMYHFTNLVLHVTNAVLVAWLLWLLLLGRGMGFIALLGGLLFALHPLQTEAVVWASARKDLLSTFFFLLSLIAYIRFRTSDLGLRTSETNRMMHPLSEVRGPLSARFWYYGSLISFALGLLSKVSIVTLPVILVLLHWRDRARWTRERLLEFIPFFLLAIVFGIIAIFGKREIVSSVTPLHYLFIAGKSTIFYLQKFFLPSGLGALYPYDKPLAGAPLDLVIPTVLGAALFLTTLLFARRRRDLSFGILLYLTTLIPTFTNIFKGKEIYFASDRYVYIPMIGILYFVCSLIALAPHARRDASDHIYTQQHPSRGAAILAVPILLLAILSYRQTQTWTDSFALFEQTLRHYPHAVAAHINLSVANRHIGNLDEALRHLDDAERIKDNMHIHTSRAAVFMKQSRFEEALSENRKAMLLDPRDPSPLYGMALTEAAMGRLQDAEQTYLQTLALEPRHLGAHNNLAAIYLERGERAKAADMYRAALAIDNTFSVAHFNLGIIAEEDGDIDEAIRRFEKTADLEPNAAIDALEHLLDLYARRNDLAKSAEAAERILRINPRHPTAGKFLEALRERGML